MFESIVNFFKRFGKNEKENSKEAAKERLHLVLAQDRANISADFLEMMKQEIIEVIKKYIDIDEEAIDVRMTNKPGEDGTVGAPALYANIPIVTIKNDARKLEGTVEKEKEVKTQEQTSKESSDENKAISKTENAQTEQVKKDKNQIEKEELAEEQKIENKTIEGAKKENNKPTSNDTNKKGKKNKK